MSYKKPDTGNSMNDLFTSWADFIQLSPNLLNADSEEAFEIWLEKALLIDKRMLYRFLKKHKQEIPERYIKAAQYHFKQEI